VQRRRQKLIEETPAPGLPPGLPTDGYRRRRSRSRRRIHRAGTYEFLVDEDREFLFHGSQLPLQVEHPVTEMVTGVDLVREQLLVATGARCAAAARHSKPHGAAMECRS